MSLIRCLTNRDEPLWDVHPLMAECEALSGQYQDIQVVHCLREANQVVDWIVKAHRIEVIPCNWLSNPPHILCDP